MRVIKWGIIGVGDVTELKSGPAYKKTEGFDIVCVMRRNANKVADFAKRHNITKYTTKADELINDPEVDAVYIATPPDSHKEYGLKVAAVAKPCCIEKPMAPTYEDSLAIYNAFKKTNTPLFIAYYRRSLPRFEQIKKWIEEEKIGTVRHIHCHLAKAPSEIDLSGAPNWRTDSNVARGGYFDDLASHQLDFFAFLFGDFTKVNGMSSNQQKLYSADDKVSASWQHKNGVTGTGTWNFGSAINEEYVEISGSEGKIIFSMFDERSIRLITQNGEEELSIPHPKHVQQYHVEQIKRALLFKEYQHPSTGKNGLHTSWVMDKILGVT